MRIKWILSKIWGLEDKSASYAKTRGLDFYLQNGNKLIYAKILVYHDVNLLINE